MFELIILNGFVLGDHLFEKCAQSRNIPLPITEIVEHFLTRILMREVKFFIERSACDNDAQVFIKDDQWLVNGVYNRLREYMTIFGVTERVKGPLVWIHSPILHVCG